MKKYQAAILFLLALGFVGAQILGGDRIPAVGEEWLHYFVMIIFTAAPAVYMIPWILSLYWSRPQSIPVFFLNAVFGWTALGWVGSLIWACISPEFVKELKD